VVDKAAAWGRDRSGRFRLVHEDASVRIYENLRSLPRAWLVEQTEVIPAPEAMLARVHAPDFDPRTTAVVDREVEWEAKPEEPALATDVRIVGLTAEEVRVEVSTPRPALLVLADFYWPGWRVSVDGIDRELRRANFLLRGVPVAPGVHEVRFAYVPSLFRIGAAISVATIIALMGGAFLRRRSLGALPRRTRRDY
jgi:hypothetical protein